MITCIEETALNLSYKGKLSIIKSVKTEKFFPQERIREIIIDITIHFLFKSFTSNKENKKIKN